MPMELTNLCPPRSQLLSCSSRTRYLAGRYECKRGERRFFAVDPPLPRPITLAGFSLPRHRFPPNEPEKPRVCTPRRRGFFISARGFFIPPQTAPTMLFPPCGQGRRGQGGEGGEGLPLLWSTVSATISANSGPSSGAKRTPAEANTAQIVSIRLDGGSASLGKKQNTCSPRNGRECQEVFRGCAGGVPKGNSASSRTGRHRGAHQTNSWRINYSRFQEVKDRELRAWLCEELSKAARVAPIVTTTGKPDATLTSPSSSKPLNTSSALCFPPRHVPAPFAIFNQNFKERNWFVLLAWPGVLIKMRPELNSGRNIVAAGAI